MVGLVEVSEPSPLSTETPSSAAVDYVEHALLAARDLIESTVTRHRRELAQDSWAGTALGKVPLAEVVDTLVDCAERAVNVVLPGNEEQTRAVCAALARPARGSRRAVVVRLLCEEPVLASSAVRALARTDPRCEIRICDGGLPPLPEALLIDGQVVYLRRGPSEPGRGQGQASLVEDAATVRALEMMFAGTWGNAVALADHPRLGGRLCPESVRRILECLRTGHTDEVAARTMQVSLRTYRRYVAEIMRELGVNSRFQAGVRAVEMGLLPGRH
ncbi:response regulator transcription factor [Streptomyces sp. NPDC021218]|uniref:response regulator transcription factor n=1 Tax=Streptomyces sp. NPDC021218 TaxID=3365119 RepID=UPI00378AB08A